MARTIQLCMLYSKVVMRMLAHQLRHQYMILSHGVMLSICQLLLREDLHLWLGLVHGLASSLGRIHLMTAHRLTQYMTVGLVQIELVILWQPVSVGIAWLKTSGLRATLGSLLRFLV